MESRCRFAAAVPVEIPAAVTERLRVGTVGSEDYIKSCSPRPTASAVVRYLLHVTPRLVPQELSSGIAERDGIVAARIVIAKVHHDTAVDPTAGDDVVFVVLRKQGPGGTSTTVVAHDSTPAPIWMVKEVGPKVVATIVADDFASSIAKGGES